MEKKQTKVLLIGIALVALLGLILIFSVSFQNTKNIQGEVQSNNQETAQRDAATNVRNNSEDAVLIDGWKVYDNKKFSFEFKYRGNLTTTYESNDSNTIISNQKDGHWLYSVNSKENSKNLSLEETVADILSGYQYKGKNIVVSDLMIDNKPAKKIQNKDSKDYGNVAVILLLGGNIITVAGDDSTSSLKTDFEDFLKSFKFKQ